MEDRGGISEDDWPTEDPGQAAALRKGDEDGDLRGRTFGGLRQIPEAKKGQKIFPRGQLEDYDMGPSPSQLKLLIH